MEMFNKFQLKSIKKYAVDENLINTVNAQRFGFCLFSCCANIFWFEWLQ